MREIGSEFWDVPTAEYITNRFPESTQWFLSGRSALKAIIEDLKLYRTVAIPSWCCDSMVKPFIDAGMEVRFYPVYWQERLIQEIDLECDVMLIMDYFGYVGPEIDVSNFKGVVIRDVTHSFFSTSYCDADYYFGSLRKWCGVWTGGYAWTGDAHKLPMEDSYDFGYISFREKGMYLKKRYIHNQETGNKTVFLNNFNAAEEALELVGIAKAADRDVAFANKLDVDGIIHKRRANATVLRNAFSDWLVFRNMQEKECPMFVPVIVPDGKRDKLRQFLINNDIYCPVHWPKSRYHKLDNKELYIYDNELSLVCDQRYDEEDMNRIIETITLFMEDK